MKQWVEARRRLVGSTGVFVALVVVFFVGVIVGQIIMAGVLR